MASRRHLTSSNPIKGPNSEEPENIFATPHPDDPATFPQANVSNNPFLGSDEEEGYSINYEDDEDAVSETSLMHNNHINNNREREISRNRSRGDSYNTTNMSTNSADYQGYYSKSNTNLLDLNGDASSSTILKNSSKNIMQEKDIDQTNQNYRKSMVSSKMGIPHNDISTPHEFDRYPAVNNRASMANPKQGSSGIYSTERFEGRSMEYGSSSDVSSNNINQINNEHDFSPFGGYPASSFPLMIDEKEDDDYMHNPDPEEEARLDRRRFVSDFKNMDSKSFGGCLGFLFLLAAAACIFVVLPALTYTGVVDKPKAVTVERLSPYSYPKLAAIRATLVDPDTPSNATSRKAMDGSSWKLVFSDEFNAEGRTFYDGDDPYWTAPDTHYDATHDLEWYSPDASTTANGTLQLRMDAYKNHDLYYRSGMVQSWNKLCFTQGILEISANLANYGRVTGLWPGLWTMGNLGRPGFLASTEGVWPYTYDSCDAGITPNQSSPDGISYLPGQRLSVCTCDGEDHPNQGVGRGAPEIDIIEGEADTTLSVGIASQSYQIAPFDIWYIPDYEFVEIHNYTVTQMNSYCGGPLQQAVSAVSTLNTSWYQFGPEAGYFQKYAIEYLNDDEDGYIRWFVGDTPTWTLHAKALHPSGNVGWRRISKEPMSIIMNLGISNNWAYIDWQSIYFPVTMSIDYVRLYQPADSVSVTCDPIDYPTYDYIQSHKNVYYNANLTSWNDAGYKTPKNILTGDCKSSKFSLTDAEPEEDATTDDTEEDDSATATASATTATSETTATTATDAATETASDDDEDDDDS